MIRILAKAVPSPSESPVPWTVLMHSPKASAMCAVVIVGTVILCLIIARRGR